LKSAYESGIPEIASFQVWLYETSNVIEFRYRSFKAGSGFTGRAYVGLKSNSGNPGDIRSVKGTYWWEATAGNDSTAYFTVLSDFSLPDSNRTFRFTPRYNNDVGVTANLAPAGSISGCSTIAPKAVVTNFGILSQSTSVTYKISGPANYISTKSISLGGGQSDTIIFDSTFFPISSGSYNVTIHTNLNTDQDRSNDTLKTTFTYVQSSYGGGAAANCNYFFANSTPCANGAPSKPSNCKWG
jgi:hypothetical protein